MYPRASRTDEIVWRTTICNAVLAGRIRCRRHAVTMPDTKCPICCHNEALKTAAGVVLRCPVPVRPVGSPVRYPLSEE